MLNSTERRMQLALYFLMSVIGLLLTAGAAIISIIQLFQWSWSIWNWVYVLVYAAQFVLFGQVEQKIGPFSVIMATVSSIIIFRFFVP